MSLPTPAVFSLTASQLQRYAYDVLERRLTPTEVQRVAHMLTDSMELNGRLRSLINDMLTVLNK